MRFRQSIRSSAALLLLAPLAGTAQSTPRPGTGHPAAATMSAFSAAVAVQGGEVFVGRPGALGLFPMPGNRPGGVHVFSRISGSWTEVATLPSPESDAATGFGEALDASGDLLVVGAPDEGPGAVYVYRRDGDGWALAERLTREQAGGGERFGAAVATNGTDILAGAPGARGGRGAAVVFGVSEDGVREVIALEPDDLPEGAAFGSAVDMRGDLAAAGAPGGTLTALPGVGAPRFLPGAVYLFSREANRWTPDGRLDPPGAGPASMGSSVAVVDGEVFAGAPLGGRGAGAVYQFRRGGGDAAADDWGLANTVEGDFSGGPTGFGMAIAVSGDDLVVGTPLAGGSLGGGAAFRRDASGEWAQVATFGPGGDFNFYGVAAAVEGDVAVVGAPGADYFEGAGFLFRRTESGWEPEGTIFDDNAGLDPVVGGERECEEGSAGVFACSDVDLVSFMPTHALGGARGMIANDLWGWTDPESGREYAIMGRADATVFVDLGDPGNPLYLGELPLTEGATPAMWRDIKVYGDHAFVVADNAGAHGVQVFDLRLLRDMTDAPTTFEPTAHYDGIASAHNIVINEETGFAYVVGASGGGETCGGGLHMVDIRDPRNPVFAGCFADPQTGQAGTGYSHDAQCVIYQGPDEGYRGREICLGANENALSIADVTDKENPVSLSSASYPNTGYLHQGWISDDHRYFYMNDETDELGGNVSRTRTLVWDIGDLEDPVLAREHFGTTGSSDHNLYVVGDLMYQANYLSGLRILDVSDPTAPEEIGFFDTVPFGADNAGFAGAWSVYPYFKSGLIIVSSIKEGLFVLRKRPPRVS